MTILKRNSDNKIIRNASGEILTKSDALIDLRSTYGVTKDGSNDVSKVKLFNNHCQVFRAPSGNEPIENGDGFDFNPSLAELSIKGLNSSTVNYSVFFWLKASVGWATNQYIMESENLFSLSLATAPNIVLRDGDGGVISFDSKLDSIDTEEWNHFGIIKDGNHVSCLVNGKKTNIETTTTSLKLTNELKIGRRFSSTSSPFYGLLGGFQVYDFPLYGISGVPEGKLVFTPPTFPNTLL